MSPTVARMRAAASGRNGTRMIPRYRSESARVTSTAASRGRVAGSLASDQGCAVST